MPIQHVGVYAPEVHDDALGAPARCLVSLFESFRTRFDGSLSLLTHGPERINGGPWDSTIEIPSTPGNAEHKINQLGVDVVHFNRPVVSRFPFVLDAPTTVICHGDLYWERPDLCRVSDTKSRIWRLVERAILPQFDRVACVSDDLARRVERRYTSIGLQTSVIYNGINHEVYSPDATINHERYDLPKRYILHVSSFAPKKNPEAIFRSFAHLTDCFEDTELVICGAGWDSEDNRERIQDMGISNRVNFTGYIPENDLPGLYANAELFLFPSHHETFGLPAVEAMACGTPVIGSSAYALPEVTDGGAIACPPNSPGMIAQAAQTLLTDDTLRESVAQLGLKQSKSFSWDRAAEEYMELINSLEE